MNVLTKTISLIIPCYNQAAFLEECLNSVVHQTFTDWECILINDGSTDKTEEICKKWIEKDARFQYIFTENKGVSNARNLGLKKATGDFIQFLDADDTMDLRNFEKKLMLSADFDIILSEFNILTNNHYFPGYNKLQKEFLDFDKLFFGWETTFTIPIHTAIISRELLKNFSFDTTLLCFEDFLMWLHLLAQNPKCAFIDEPLVSYRKEENLTSASSNLEKIVAERIKLLPLIKARYGVEKHDLYVYHFLKIKSSENIALKNYVQQLQNTKILKFYLKLKKLFN